MADAVKKIAAVAAISVLHLAICMGLTAFGAGGFGISENGLNPAFNWVIVWITRILYFPVLTLSLYSRHWFPGNWIYIPICVNSLLWGIFLFASYCLLKRCRKRYF
jgi:hypothetical protein